MSHLADTRAAIAAALSTVDDVRGFTKKPVSRNAGDAWPSWAGGLHVTGGTYGELSWTVYVLVPGDEDARETWISGRLEALTVALLEVVWVVGVETGTVDDQPALVINCRE